MMINPATMNENHIVKTEFLTANRGRFTAGTTLISVVTVDAFDVGRAQMTAPGGVLRVDDAFVHSVDEVVEHLGRNVPYLFKGVVVRYLGGKLVYDVAGFAHPVPIPFNA